MKGMKNLRKSILFCLVAGALPLWAQSGVDSAELETATEAVNFVSNSARPAVFNTRAQIREIGGALGRAIHADNATAGVPSRYFVLHNRYPKEADKLDADSFGLGPDAGVDTINNLRIIIAAYLEAAYDYAPSDAALLARFVTVYNAVHRADLSFVSTRYKTPVLYNLPAGKAGLAVQYTDWPGKTLMLIPLQTATAGSLSAVNTTAITDAAVTGKLREASDKSLADRKAMAAFKEREADAAREQAAALRAQNDAAAKSRFSSDETTTTGAPAAQRKAADSDDTESAQREAAAAEADALAARKDEEAQSARAGISADQNAALAAANPNAAPPAAAEEAPKEPPPPPIENTPPAVEQSPAKGVIVIKMQSPDSPYGVVVKVSPATGETVKTSALTEVNARSFVKTAAGRCYVIAGRGANAHIVEVNQSTLESVAVSASTVNENTEIWEHADSLYALVENAGKTYVARFDGELAVKAVSKVAAHLWASLIFAGDKVVTQGADGAPIMLDANDLSE
jgi:hypothetical protein